jgi:hypothetical protein
MSASADRDSAAQASGTLSAEAVPTSFGAFKPVGHLMLGLPTQAQCDALQEALLGAGWPRDEVRNFAPGESVAQLEAMVDNSGTVAGFGYEINLLRRYLALAREGCVWLLVKVADLEHAQAATELARARGALIAVYYRTLTIEDLL